MIDAVVTLLQNDATLAAILTGGVHRAVEISRQETPGAFDNNRELLPCALVKQESATSWGPHPHSGRLYIAVWFYQRRGYDAVEAARKRVYQLLHRRKLMPGDGSGCYEMRHAGDLLDAEEAELGVSMAMSRYVATVERR
ncbi:hypothetical protein [Caldilinea sp.]|uniref:hypothetical protein n=1 Tax=Caldilinea sp. TaxID=2293560 RepID=UPI0021DCCCDC|nr:hypothetical protein [Caldilinea sp.]GIV73540.1 MAG: hypothetical protein KatS3mg049_2096 [Caldilinea sp.]